MGNLPGKIYWIGLSLIAITGMGLVLYSTVWGAGLISDSFQYIATAKTMASHGYWGYLSEDGSFIPLTQYPPFFPAVLALLEFLGINSLNGVRFFNATLMGINIILVGVTLRYITKSALWSILGAVLFAFNRVFLEAHAWALSEPLYYFLALLGLYLLALSIDRQDRRYWWAEGVLALAALTRYIGIALIFSGMLVLLGGKKPVWQKVIRSLSFGGLSLLPLGLWTLRNALLTKTINNRSLSFVPLTIKNILSLIQTILGWFVPSVWVIGHEKIWLFLLIVLSITLGIWWVISWRTSQKSITQTAWFNPLAILWFFATIFHLAFLIIAKIGFDHNIGFGDRLLSPLWLGGIILIVTSMAVLWEEKNAISHWLVILCGSYLIVYFLAGSIVALPAWHKQGLGLARKSWHTSQAILTLQTLDSGRIYSNSPSTVYLWTGSPGHSLTEFSQIRESNSSVDVYLVVFHHIPENARLTRLEDGLPIVIEDRIATIYRYPP